MFEKLVSELKAQVIKKQQQAAQRYLHSLNPADWIEAQRAIGAEAALLELERRWRSANGLRPEWAERLDPVGVDMDLRPRIKAEHSCGFPAPARITKRRLA